jgi:hypothetical protein
MSAFFITALRSDILSDLQQYVKTPAIVPTKKSLEFLKAYLLL